MKEIEIVVFSGGRGTRAIQEAFSGVDNIRVTYLINGYDSGLSTGEVRRVIPGMLGPSDFRKALTGISQSYEANSARQLSKLFEHRLPVSRDNASANFDCWSTVESALEFVASISPELEVDKALKVASEMHRFYAHVESHPESKFDCSDLAIGNAYFGGAFLRTRGFNTALEEAKSLFELPGTVDILNVTAGDDLWLTVTTAESHISVEEGHFVTVAPPAPINSVFLIDRPTFYQHRDTYSEWKTMPTEALSDVVESQIAPEPNQTALERIAKANLIVYGSGTLHSSLIPSYITSGVSEAIASNTKSLKILFVNGGRDVDIHESVERQETVAMYEKYLGATSERPLTSLVTEIWISGGPWAPQVSDAFVGTQKFAGIPVRQLTDDEKTKYTETESYVAFSHALSRHVGVTLGSKSNVASIVVPLWNEAIRLPLLKGALPQLEKTLSGSLIEIIVVDGNSTDGSLEQVQTWPDVRLLKSPGRGRGTAIAEGIRQSRGGTIGVFHADGEYDASDIQAMIRMAEQSPETLYVASRTHGAGGSYALRKVYEGHGFQYWISRTGGVVLSALLSLRLGRTVSDPFSGVFACSSEIAREHFTRCGDVDSFIKGLISAHKAGIPIVEVGVDYVPRSANDGKKTNTGTGLAALWSVFN